MVGEPVEQRTGVFRGHGGKEYGYWWIEWGGRLDTVRQTEEIKWELWKVVYGVLELLREEVGLCPMQGRRRGASIISYWLR